MRPIALLLLASACHSLPAEVVRAEPLAGPSLLSLADTLPEVSEHAVQSVVSVQSRRRATSRSSAPSLGSGVVIREDGIVVTNNHVVEDAVEVVVTLPDGNRELAEVVGTDPKSDLAVLRLVDPPADLVPLAFGDSDALRLGEIVLAVGTPFGVGQTVTMGIVSAKGRADMGIVDYEDFIQTDAAINPGNSGGALVDLRGTLVGINTAIFSRSGGSMGIGFAIPASMAEQVVDDILEDGHVDRGWLGVSIQDVDPDERDALGLSNAVRIAGVQPGTPAEAAGLQRGDMVVAFDGEVVKSAARFRNRVASSGAARPFAVTVIRDGKSQIVRGTLGDLPSM